MIRTDVRTETLDGAQFLARRMNELPALLYDAELRDQFNARVESASFRPEMKMASGYFGSTAWFDSSPGTSSRFRSTRP